MDRLSEAQIQNYTLISKVGQGASAEVILAKQNSTKTLCALKMIQKSLSFDQDEQKRAVQQRLALTDLYHPFLIKIHQAFQTRNHFCLAMQYCPGGDLYTHLHMSQRFSEEKISFYASQLVLALEYLHSQNIIFRDLKPENILINKDGYLKLIDFGMAKLRIQSDNSRTFSVCGTSQYTSPEILQGQGHGRAFDWWTLGCCLYELVYQISPFYSDDRSEMFDRILNEEPIFDETISINLASLIKGLLEKNPEKRMEFVKNIKSNKFFSKFDFGKILRKQYSAPYVPEYAKGKKMLKVIKDEVSPFMEFDNQKTSKSVYVSGFDYNCGYEQQTTDSSEQENEKNTEKVSTEDDYDQRSQESFGEKMEKKIKSLWETF